MSSFNKILKLLRDSVLFESKNTYSSCTHKSHEESKLQPVIAGFLLQKSKLVLTRIKERNLILMAITM